MDVREILEKWLKENGFDGLVEEDNECSCKIGDLAPCDNTFIDCRPGYMIPCTCGGGCAFHITTVHPIQDAVQLLSCGHSANETVLNSFTKELSCGVCGSVIK